MTADAAEDEGCGGDEGRKRESDSAMENPNVKRPRKSMGWGRGLVRKKVPEKTIEQKPNSTMVTAVLIAALSSSGAVSPPSKLQAAMRAVKSNDAIAALSPGQSAAKAEDIPDGVGIGSAAADAEDPVEPIPEDTPREPSVEEAPEPAPKPAPAEVPMCKEELLLTIETTDSEIAKLEARLAELKEEEEAEQEQGDAARQAVLPFPAEYHVNFVDLRGQQMHSIYLQNGKTRIRSKRKHLLGRLMPPEVLEKVAAGTVLYQCPQDLQSYHENIASHAKLRPEMIEILMNQREAYKRKCNKLQRQWHLLNAKYESKLRAKSNSGSRSNSRGGRGSNQRSGMRGNAISARSPRDTGVARSDMELNQIISELEEEERSRHRFEFNLAKIPSMIVDPRQREAQIFISKNALVEDPVHENRIFSISDTWNEQEKKQFFDKYMSFPKNFRKIAASLPYKTTQDCIRFYYRYKKELDLKTKLKQHQLKKRPGKKGSTTVLERTPHKLEPPQLLGKHAREDDADDQQAVQNGQMPKKNKIENWSEQDKNRFIRHIKAIGKDWKKLSRAMGSGFSASDVQSYYQLSQDSIETILDEQAELKKEAEAKAKAKKEARKQAQQAIQHQQRQQPSLTKQELSHTPVNTAPARDANMIDEWTRQHGAKPAAKKEPPALQPAAVVKPEASTKEQPPRQVSSLPAAVAVAVPNKQPGLAAPPKQVLEAPPPVRAEEPAVVVRVEGGGGAATSAAATAQEPPATSVAARTEGTSAAGVVGTVGVAGAPATAKVEEATVAPAAGGVAKEEVSAATSAGGGVGKEEASGGEPSAAGGMGAATTVAAVEAVPTTAAEVAAEEARAVAKPEVDARVAAEEAPATTEVKARVVEEEAPVNSVATEAGNGEVAKEGATLTTQSAPTLKTTTGVQGASQAEPADVEDDKVETLSEGIADDL